MLFLNVNYNVIAKTLCVLCIVYVYQKRNRFTLFDYNCKNLQNSIRSPIVFAITISVYVKTVDLSKE